MAASVAMSQGQFGTERMILEYFSQLYQLEVAARA